MLFLKRKIFIAILVILLVIAAFTRPKESNLVKSGTDAIVIQTEETESEEKPGETEYEADIISDWAGVYGHHGDTPPGGYIDMDLIIYSDRGEHFGYLSIDADGWDSRMLLEIRGNKDKIELYFMEHITEAADPHESLSGYQSGDLLFSLVKEDGEIKPIWQELLPDEEEEDLNRGFHQHNGDSFISMILKDEKDKIQFLKARGISQQERPFYQYYTEDGELLLDFYYDMTDSVGTGIYYSQVQEQTRICGFDIKSCSMDVWEEKEPFAEIGREEDLQLDEYEEERVYNDQGQLTYFCSYALRTERKGTFTGKVVEIESTYREDGTLKKQKKDLYHSGGFPYHSGTYYYDKQEILVYATSYITSGYAEDFYIYDKDSRKPAFCLKLGHMGPNTYEDEFIKYD